MSRDKVAAALEAIQALQRSLQADGSVASGPSMTVRAVVELYVDVRRPKHKKPRAWQTIESKLGIVVARLGDRDVMTLVHADMDEFIAARMRDDGVSRVTACRGLQLFSAAVNVAVKRRRLPHNPLTGYEYDAPAGARTRVYTAREIELMLVATRRCDLPLVRGVVAVMRHTGIRPGELIRSEVKDLNWSNGLLRIPAKVAKTGTERSCVVWPDGLDALREIDRGDSPWLFPSTRKSHAGHVSHSTLSRQWRKVYEVACIEPNEDGSPPEIYSLRTTLATRLAIDEGLEPHQLMAAMGWKSINQAKAYVKPGDRHLLEQAAKLQAAQGGAGAHRHLSSVPASKRRT